MIAPVRHRDINKSASALNPDKMLWTQPAAHHACHGRRACGSPRCRSSRRSASQFRIVAELAAVARAQQERAQTLKEMAENSLFFFRDPPGYDEKAAAKHLTRETAPLLAARPRSAGGARRLARPRAARGSLGGRCRTVGGARQGGPASSRRGHGRSGIAAHRRDARDPGPGDDARAARPRDRTDERQLTGSVS